MAFLSCPHMGSGSGRQDRHWKKNQEDEASAGGFLETRDLERDSRRRLRDIALGSNWRDTCHTARQTRIDAFEY